ncbi:glycosyltransferase family 4 protein [Rhodoblastus acidophilus]|uniref:glycosyltransferase family 4 protein n=1 Tax=Rhodoblastus acidophilus TaxID=1074 RepID=UPI0030B8EFAC
MRFFSASWPFRFSSTAGFVRKWFKASLAEREPMKPKVARAVVYAPHFAEYSTRLAFALGEAAEVLLILDRLNREQEVEPALLAALPARVQWMEFESVGRFARMVSLVHIVLRVLAFRPHVIFMQEQIDALSAWVARTTGRVFPILLTVHDPAPHSGNDAQYVIDNAQNRRVLRATARAYHVHGPFCRRQLRREIEGDKPIVETAHGIILVSDSSARLDPEQGRILMFGRMEAYKGLDVLINAIGLLESRNIPHHLVIAGRGPELDRLAPTLAARRSVEIVNAYLTPSEASRQFQRASIVVTPYVNATQSGVVAAAFGNGRPVVASNTGGLADAVVHEANGLLAPPGDALALADVLQRALCDVPLLQHITRGAEASATRAFAWRTVAHSLTAFHQSTISGA